MAQISITINAEGLADYHDTLRGLLNQAAPTAPRRTADVGVTGEGIQSILREEEAQAEAEQADSPQPEAQRRTRRTKAQIAADEAAASGTPASGSQDLGDLLGAAAGQTATTDASPSDLAAALEQAEASVTAGEGVVTIDTVKAAISQAMGCPGQSPKTVMTAMQAALGEHAKSAGSLKPEEYPAAMVVLNKIIAG